MTNFLTTSILFQTTASVLMGWGCLIVLFWVPSAAQAQLPSGLTKSRWAMDDPEYAEKYAHGAAKTDIAGKLKQANDARFVDHHSGYYLSAGLTAIGKSNNPLGSIEAGYTGYGASFMTSRAGLIAAANDEDYFLGGEIGMRFQTPSRLAPFVGTGLFTGISSGSEPATDDGIDNDDDGRIDERHEERETFDGALSAIYPEVGIHFWWTPRTRLTGFGRYLITTDGRANDAWYYGFSIAILSKEH
ncbi:hypothetical protein Poly21_24680 [Allorhodopirellula heiligendammensis]|uniref:Outer membrane protein beta-barrel domain-containing protein n=1 Tax=Allorhodopirellula heiligendammensis TaxID=2714739 RepID=A0A5C6BSQ4_9BACT|nr:hypothetical protein Poly21_24680 [Allorhodopirellula heiligendammensis]